MKHTARQTKLDAKELRELLHYDPETGIFTWLPRPRVRGGKVAGNLSASGYLRIGLGGKPSRTFQAHRLAWLYMTGSWPAEDIDHVNGDRADNRWCNLRAVTRSVNLQNMRKAKSNSSTGHLGVQRNKARFSARINADGKTHHLGTFDTPEQAHGAYVAAKRRLHEGCTL